MRYRKVPAARFITPETGNYICHRSLARLTYTQLFASAHADLATGGRPGDSSPESS